MVLTGRRKWILMGSIGINILVLYALYAGVIKVFLPNQVAAIDPQAKVNNLALLYAVMSIFTTLATPLSGALSDRARTRWGRRTPFIAIGSLAGAALIFGLSSATTFWSILVLWVMAAFCCNVMQVPMTTLIADRFAPGDRGKAAGLLSAGQNIGTSAGVVFAGYFFDQIQLGYVVFAAALLASCLAFILVNREPSSIDIPVERFSLAGFLGGFWVDPRQHPDFAWAFGSRLCFYMGFTLITTYLLYILEDYIGLSKADANLTLGRIFSIQLVGLLLMGLTAGFISDRLGRRKLFVIIATVMVAAAYAMPLLMPTVQGMLIYGAIVGIGYGAFTAVDMALMTDVLPRTANSDGRNLGLLIIALNIPLVLGPVVAAAILNLTGQDYRALFIVAAGLIALSAFLVAPIRSVR